MSIQELLGLPSDVTQPNAYQLFGLELGESDQATIHAAIARRISALKKAKSKAPPETWKRAAMAVQAAQRTLKDPAAKAKLDASFGIIAEPATLNEPAAAKPVTDPLASLLPSATTSPITASAPVPQPAAPVPQPAAPVPQSAVPKPEPTIAHQPIAVPASMRLGHPPLGTAASPGATAEPTIPAAEPTPASVMPAAAAPVIRRRQPVRRRKSSGGLIFGTLVLLLLSAIVGGMGYFFWKGPGGVQFVKTDNGFEIKTGGQPASTSMVAPPRAENSADSRSSGDGVMKTPNATGMGEQKSLGAELNQPTRPDPSGMPAEMGMPSMSGMPANLGMPSQPRNTPAATPPPKKPASTKPPTEAEISAGQLSINTATDAIRMSNWDSMKSLAEMAETKAVTRDQKQQAETVYQFADLATHYRGGIRLALAELPTNSEISITNTRKVLVNEADENHLKINLGKGADGKPNLKNYQSDELPLVLAHELAGYKIDMNSPEGQAARAVFQSIASLATPGHRTESVKILRGLNQVEGADPKRLADFIEALGQ